MRDWHRWVLLCATATVSFQAIGREEIWEVAVWPAPWDVEYKAIWRLNISESGAVSGVSTWETDDGTGLVNKIDGHIAKGGQIKLTRYIAGKNAGRTQEYTGEYKGNRLATEGSTAGFGGPGSWVAGVTVNKE